MSTATSRGSPPTAPARPPPLPKMAPSSAACQSHREDRLVCIIPGGYVAPVAAHRADQVAEQPPKMAVPAPPAGITGTPSNAAEVSCRKDFTEDLHTGRCEHVGCYSHRQMIGRPGRGDTPTLDCNTASVLSPVDPRLVQQRKHTRGLSEGSCTSELISQRWALARTACGPELTRVLSWGNRPGPHQRRLLPC